MCLSVAGNMRSTLIAPSSAGTCPVYFAKAEQDFREAPIQCQLNGLLTAVPLPLNRRHCESGSPRILHEQKDGTASLVRNGALPEAPLPRLACLQTCMDQVLLRTLPVVCSYLLEEEGPQQGSESLTFPAQPPSCFSRPPIGPCPTQNQPRT